MKFGETLYQRSVPEWSTYNVNYNEIKRLIKERTSIGAAVPTSIPSGSKNDRWRDLENDLFVIFKDQNDNVSLFLRSKSGEIDRRLCFLEKQVSSARKAAERQTANPTLQERRYHKLLVDAESIGQDIQNLTRFAAVQKTAFRKLIKKYRKWTGSTALQIRLEREVFAWGQLNPDYAQQLDRLAVQLKAIADQAKGTSLKVEVPRPLQLRMSSSIGPSVSAVTQIRSAQEKGPVALDAALATIPFGTTSGVATYWIHPDNLDEAHAHLLRYARELYRDGIISRQNSNSSISSTRSNSSGSDITYLVLLDNKKRFVQDTSTNKPSKIAMSGRWGPGSEAVITLSNPSTLNSPSSVINMRRKDVFKAITKVNVDAKKNPKQRTESEDIKEVQSFLAEHRDVKSFALVRSTRSRYAGTANSAQVGIWVTSDSDIVISPFTGTETDSASHDAESGDAFPHAVVEVRWEFCHTPEIVRVFDSSHFAERVHNFSLESMAVHFIGKDLEPPHWKTLLEKDIRRVPATTGVSSKRRNNQIRGRPTVIGTSSGNSSTDGPSDSVFSTQYTASTNTSVRDLASIVDETSPPGSVQRGKRKAHIGGQSPPPRQSRYWNEFDDGDEDVNPQEVYTIYVDPNKSFPGSKTVSKAFSAMYTSLESAGGRVSAVLSLKPRGGRTKRQRLDERSRILSSGSLRSSEDADSSDSDTEGLLPPHQSATTFGTFPTPKSKSDPQYGVFSTYRAQSHNKSRSNPLERIYLFFYVGLIALSYVLLLVSGVLLAVGRRKAYLEIDGAVIAGITVAVVCAIASMILLWGRKTPLSIVHKGIVQVAIVSILVLSVGEIVILATKNSHRTPTPFRIRSG